MLYAVKVLERSPLFVQQLPDFSLQDIENTIKRGIRDNDVKYIFFDYINLSNDNIGKQKDELTMSVVG